MRIRTSRVTLALLGAAAAVLVATAVTPALSGRPSTSAPVTTTSTALAPDAQTAIAQLEQLKVAEPDHASSYQRTAFGPAWADTDHNGCDQRNDSLNRALVDVTTEPGTHGCVVLSGTLHDPYTGQTIAFHRGAQTSQLVQIDHVVPLAWAWRQGASGWTAQQREIFATKAINLQAVDGAANQAKSDKGPADWMPPNPGYRCTYAIRFVQVLAAYNLTVDPADDHALQTQLRSCS